MNIYYITNDSLSGFVAFVCPIVFLIVCHNINPNGLILSNRIPYRQY